MDGTGRDGPGCPDPIHQVNHKLWAGSGLIFGGPTLLELGPALGGPGQSGQNYYF